MEAVIIIILSLAVLCLTLKPNIRVDELSVGHPKTYEFNNMTEYVISVDGLLSDFEIVPPRINVKCQDCSNVNPTFIIVKQKRVVTVLQLPHVVKISDGKEVFYNETERTLCPNQEVDTFPSLRNSSVSGRNFSHEVSDRSLTIELSTTNPKNVTLNVIVTLVTDFLLELGKNKTFIMTPSMNALYLYRFPENVSSVILKEESEQDICMMVIIVNRSCPMIFNKHGYSNGYFETVSHLGAVTLTKDQFPQGFYADFKLRPDDTLCRTPILKGPDKTKTVVLTLLPTIPASKYHVAVWITVAVILIIYILSITVTCCLTRVDINIPVLNGSNLSSHGASSSATLTVTQVDSETIQSPTTDTLSVRTDSSMDEEEYDTVNDAEEDKNVFRTKTILCLSDLAKKNPTVLRKKSNLYLWHLTTVAIFYVLPASQLVYTYLDNMRESGNLDMCYYNFLCSHPLWKLADFNHFFSNIGYLSLGFLFIILTRRKDSVHRALRERDMRLDREYGVPQHFGLYYAMGTSLVIEGILSACYHLCPNKYSFQYDSSFMYIISVLCIVKIYQSRHPDVNATAYSTFLLIAFVLFVVLFGALGKVPYFRALFTILHIIICFYLSLKIYYVGRVELNFKSIIRQLRYQYRQRFIAFRPQYPTRFGLIAVINFCNWGLAATAIKFEFENFFSYLLMIFIVNLTLYTLFYIIMKLFSGEKIGFQPTIYIILSIASWSLALYYFHNRTMSWMESPAQSRVRNKPCILFDFYDNHDVWHFISAGALFFSFMVLLTLDDDLVFVHRCQIRVF